MLLKMVSHKTICTLDRGNTYGTMKFSLFIWESKTWDTEVFKPEQSLYLIQPNKSRNLGMLGSGTNFSVTFLV